MSIDVKNQNEGGQAAGGEGAPAADAALTNLKAEFQRKYGNLEAQNMELQRNMQALLAATKPAQAPAAKPKLDDVWFDKPAQAADIISNQIKAEMRQEMQQQAQAQQRQAKTIGALMQDFPELQDNSHALTKRAVEIFDAMDADEKTSPVAYRAAVKEAALELNVKPKSKRPVDDTSDDSFTVSGSNGGDRPRRSTKQGEIDARTKTFAAAVGLDLDKPENKTAAERIKTRHGRKSYENWG